MRGLQFLLIILVVYYAVRAISRSAIESSRKKDKPRSASRGEEMVLDPECRTYVIKNRAVTRRIGGTLYSFCSEACARRFEEK
ncbi:MAG TPA: hypothetical protein VF903_03245, partial [Nitrospirota bacterium]